MKLSVSGEKNGKMRIYADGEFRFSVPADVWYSSGLTRGDEVGEAELAALRNSALIGLCHESALHMLSLRAHSEFELETKLTAKYGAEAARLTLKRLKKAGLTDDRSFAFLLAEELSGRKLFAPKRIAAELCARGISSALANEAASSIEAEGSGQIKKFLEKLNVSSDSPKKDRAKAFGRLLAMGYSYSEIKRFISPNGDP